MDKILIRFPVVGQEIFKKLDSKSLAKCRKVGKIWQTFLDNDSTLWRRRIQKYAKNQIEFCKAWKLVSRNVSVKVRKKLALALEKFYAFLPKRQKKQHSPLHIMAHRGSFSVLTFQESF